MTWLQRVWCFLTLAIGLSAAPALADSPDTPAGPDTASRVTPIAGEPYHTRFAGRDIDIEARNRRSVTSWDLGLQINPRLPKRRVLPIGSLYLWRHPDADHLLRATLAGVYNNAFYAVSPDGWGNFEVVHTFTNDTVPADRSEYVDGRRIKRQELTYGTVRGGLGLGWRRQVAPGYQDNMQAAALTVEPGYLYFSRGDADADDFTVPEDTYETRLHLRLRWDALQRNLLGLAHRGFAMGADAVAAHRDDWDDWGRGLRQDGAGHQDYSFVNAYIGTASGLPGLASPKHRVLTALHAGIGDNLDRFSAPRLGGQPAADEYGAIASPVIPGALVREFYPNHYAVATGEYRYQATFFTYVGLRGGVAYLDRNRLGDSSRDIHREDDVLLSIGPRVTTGFVFDTRLQLEYDYNFDVVRQGDMGGNSVLLHVSGSF